MSRNTKTILRNLIVIIDQSEKMKQNDYNPSRNAMVRSSLIQFIGKFFDQNPLSRMGLVMMKKGKAAIVSDLNGNADELKSFITRQEEECKGEVSVQHGLTIAITCLRFAPTFGSREILLIFGSGRTFDSSDMQKTIKDLQLNKIKVSVISLGSELHILAMLARETGGVHFVPLDEKHLQEIFQQQIAIKSFSSDRKVNEITKKKQLIFEQHSLSSSSSTELISSELSNPIKERIPTHASLIPMGFPSALSPEYAKLIQYSPLSPISRNIHTYNVSQQIYQCPRYSLHNCPSCEVMKMKVSQSSISF
ncbi:MAG: putative general transcription factor TFIIH subunit 2 [Streblomastix strix]|uniref:Putative general transcription factor TFIIH subunit 2 n=1 Tax=Streblomastix strix TaxID=222440 RepID=A0A5J4WYT3_9EUKA|nr:MAG: putative general transcription factor TFIIH subunit 2 [Streblomastix strix]